MGGGSGDGGEVVEVERGACGGEVWVWGKELLVMDVFCCWFMEFGGRNCSRARFLVGSFWLFSLTGVGILNICSTMHSSKHLAFWI